MHGMLSMSIFGRRRLWPTIADLETDLRCLAALVAIAILKSQPSETVFEKALSRSRAQMRE